MQTIQLTKIENVNYSVNKDYNFDIFNIDDITTNFKNEINYSESYITIELTINLKDQNNVILLTQTLKYEFEGDFTNTMLQKGEKNIEKEREFQRIILNVMNIALGCARGVIFAKTINHPYLSQYIMPLIATATIKDEIKKLNK